MELREQLAGLIEIKPEVFDYFSRCMWNLHQKIHFILSSPDHPIFESLQTQIAAVGKEAQQHLKESNGFKHRMHRDGQDSNQELRIWAVSEALSWVIPRTRLLGLEPSRSEA